MDSTAYKSSKGKSVGYSNSQSSNQLINKNQELGAFLVPSNVSGMSNFNLPVRATQTRQRETGYSYKTGLNQSGMKFEQDAISFQTYTKRSLNEKNMYYDQMKSNQVLSKPLVPQRVSQNKSLEMIQTSNQE